MAGLQTDDAILKGLSDAKVDEADIEKRDITQLDVARSDQPVIVDGVELPSEEDRINLRRIPAEIPWAAFVIAFVELAERFSYYGTTVVFTNFIQRPLPPGSVTGAGGRQAGALGMGQQASTGLTTFNTFWVYLMPLFGAYLADAHWGRYKTISIAVGIAMFGHILLIIAAIPPVIVNAKASLACFIIAILVMGVGTGGFKSSISPLVAEQMEETRLTVQTRPNGERVILDPTMTASRIYMYFYLMINIGAIIGQVTMTYSEKFVGFWLAYLLPTVVFLLCPIVLFVGRNRYVRRPPQGSLFGKAWRTFRLAAKGRWHLNPFATIRDFKKPDFWENVKPSRFTAETRPSWMTFDDVFVDEFKRGLRACSVFLWFPIYWLTYNQLNNNLTSQAAVMNTEGVPNDLLSNLDPLALIILIPICDKVIYPALRKAGINFSPIKRITFGFLTGSASMVWAAVIQAYIYQRSSCGYNAGDPDCEPVDINVWAQTGAYVLIAISEIFASITGLEYAFSKAPKSMRSMVMAIFLFMSAISSAIGEAFVPLSADPLLVWNYGAMAVLSFLAGVGFWFTFKHLDSQEHYLNEIGNGAPGEGATRDSGGSSNSLEKPAATHDVAV